MRLIDEQFSEFTDAGKAPQGRYSSSTDATNAWELTAAGPSIVGEYSNKLG